MGPKLGSALFGALESNVVNAVENISSDGASDLVGQVIAGRYKIEALLGRGGMGCVFRAQHLALERTVAIKLLHGHLGDDPTLSKRFDREALSASKLDHPNCVQVLDFGTTERGSKFIVMQYLQGQELRELTGRPLAVDRVVSIGLQILDALDHAHRRGMVHRDLKPENVFIVLDDDGREVVKLVDFGIVKLLDGGTQEQLTRAGMAFGTPRYMSPEQATAGKIDERTDLYAVGIILHELLTGLPPFDADEPGLVLRMHILAEPPPLPPSVPEPVVAVIAKLLAKSPSDRYASAKEAKQALTIAAYGEDTSLASGSGPVVIPPSLAPTPAVIPPAPIERVPAAALPTPMPFEAPPPPSAASGSGIPFDAGPPPAPPVAASSFNAGPVPSAPPSGPPSGPAFTAPHPSGSMPAPGAPKGQTVRMGSADALGIDSSGQWPAPAPGETVAMWAHPQTVQRRRSKVGVVVTLVLVGLGAWVGIALWLGPQCGLGSPAGVSQSDEPATRAPAPTEAAAPEPLKARAEPPRPLPPASKRGKQKKSTPERGTAKDDD